MNEPDPTRNPIDILAESFVARYRRGEAVSAEDYAVRHPDLAEQIRRVFPTLVLLEELRPAGAVTGSPSKDPRPERPPEIVGRLRLVREIGRGGMGTVYEARPVDADDDDAAVAVKMVHPHLLGDATSIQRFLREVEIGRRVSHPAVVRTLDAGLYEDDAGREVPYLVLEYVEGTSLGELADSLGGVIPEALLRHLARQIAGGLAAIHAHDIVHRDVKPSNLLVTRDQRVRIMDLGVARLQDAADAISRTGQFVGSVRYAAPEQFKSQAAAIGPATDLYALGVTLYELATGSHPFPAAAAQALVLAHVNERPRTARQRNPQLSAFFSEVIDVLLEKEIARRIGSAAHLEALLEEGERSDWWAARRERAAQVERLVSRPDVSRDIPLTGRAAPLARLLAAYREACDGTGRVVLVQGEDGLGKTRLADAFIEQIANENVRVLYGSLPPGGADDGLREAVLGAFGTARLEAALQRYLPDNPDLPAFVAHLTGRPTPAQARALDGIAIRALYGDLVRALAAERPLVWIVDDLHFAWPESRRTVLHMSGLVSDLRALLVVTSREPGPALREAVARSARSEVIALAPLTQESRLAILRDVLGTARWVEPLAERIATESGGNPLFLIEMLKEVAKARDVSRVAGTTTLGTEYARRLPVPGAVRDLVQMRLGAVDERERPILECGALCGFTFEPLLVASALGRDALDVLQILGALERRLGVVRSAGDLYRFDHHQIQEVLVQDLAPPLKRVYHGRLAASLASALGVGHDDVARAPHGEDAARLARHALRGGEVGLAHRVVLTAVEHRAAHFATEQALDLCRGALDAEPTPALALRARLLLWRGRLCDVLGHGDEYEQAATDFLAAAEALGDVGLLSEAYRMGGLVRARRGEGEAAEAWLRSALASARDPATPEREAAVRLSLAHVLATGGRYEESIEHAARARDIARLLGNPLIEGEALFCAGMFACYAGRYRDALEDLRAALALVEDQGGPGERTRMRAHGASGNAHYMLGAYAAARESYEASLVLARRIGDREAAMSTLDNLGGVFLALGRLGEALDSYRAALVLVDEAGLPVQKRLVLSANLGGAWLAAGNLAEAARLLEEALRLAREHGSPRMEGYTLHDLALLARAEGRPVEAVARAASALAVRTPLGMEGMAETHLLLGALAAQDDPAAATAHLLEAEAIATQGGEAGAAARAAAWLAILGNRGVETLSVPENMARLEESALRLLLARAGAHRVHREEAAQILEDVERSLPLEQRPAFRASSPYCRALDAAAN